MKSRRILSVFALFVAVVAVAFVGGRWVGEQAAYVYLLWHPQAGFEQADNRAYFASAEPQVVMFGTGSCPYCAQTRELFARLGVSYREHRIDASEDARRLYAGLGVQTVPVTMIGDRRIYGYREDVLRDALARLSARSGDVPLARPDASP